MKLMDALLPYAPALHVVDLSGAMDGVITSTWLETLAPHWSKALTSIVLGKAPHRGLDSLFQHCSVRLKDIQVNNAENIGFKGPEHRMAALERLVAALTA